MTALAAEATIGIARWLPGLSVALGDIGFRIVLFHPGDDVFGVERNAVDTRCLLCLKFSEDQAHAVGQQELSQGIRQVSQHEIQVLPGGKTGMGIETAGLGRVQLHWKSEQPYETGMFDQVAPQVSHRGQGFIEPNQFGGGECRIRNGHLAPVALQIAFRDVRPI